MPNPLDNPELYNRIILAGSVSPGQAEVSTAARTQAWDIKEGKGQSGATTTHQGTKISKFKVRFLFWATDQFASWDIFKLLLAKSPDPKNPTALDIEHPWLEELNIRTVSVDEQGQQTHEGKGLFAVIVSFLEFKPPKKSGGTPKAGYTGGAAPKSAQSEADKEIERLLNIARKA